MINSKTSLRKHFLQIRKAITKADAKIAASYAADIFLQNINTDTVKNIALYHPVNGEIDPANLAFKLLSKTKKTTFSLPKIVSRDTPLLFSYWQYGEELASNIFYPHIFEPANHKNHVIPEIIIVPLVAFDNNCRRLGYGGGFYDRTIAKLRANETNRRLLTIGYAYECQKSVHPLPIEAHDIALDYVITEKQVYPCI